MIKPPSIQNEYTLIYSGDPALNLPESADEREHALSQARQTGQWQALIREGEQPTLFHFGQITRTQRDWLIGEMQRRQLCATELDALIVRVALRRIDGLGPHKVTRSKSAAAGFHLADEDTINMLENVSAALIPELSWVAWERATNPLRPL